jgi:hypothetical protein
MEINDSKLEKVGAVVDGCMKAMSCLYRYASYTRKNGDTVPARMSDQEMGLVADYVLQQATNGWQ